MDFLLARDLVIHTGGVPPIVPCYPLSKDKEKCQKWNLAEYEPKPGLKLKHWVNSDPAAYSQFNRSVAVISYSQIEYDQHLHTLEWSKEETDYLFQMAKEFDLNFIVMADRFKFKRTIEELKERYYSVTRKILEVRRERGLTSHEEGYFEAPESYHFDRELEEGRKLALEAMSRRTAAEMDEEYLLLVELHKLEAMMPTLLRNRDELLKKMHIPNAYKLLQQPQKSAEKEKKKKKPITPLTTTKSTEKLPGVYLQSSRISQFKSNLRTRMEATFLEFSLPFKPTMPTQNVCESFEECMTEITLLCEFRRQKERLENEIKMAQTRRSHLDLQTGQTPSLQRKRSFSSMTPAPARDLKKRKT